MMRMEGASLGINGFSLLVGAVSNRTYEAGLIPVRLGNRTYRCVQMIIDLAETKGTSMHG